MTPKQKTAGWLAILIATVGAYEGLSLTAYPDIVGVPTICYGETKNVKLGQKATKEDCDAQLSARLLEFNRGVESCVTHPMRDNERIAFVSLSYNIGTAAFCTSSVVRRFNTGDKAGACDAILAFNKVCKERDTKGKCIKLKAVQGLTNRREQERTICLRDY